MANTLLAQPEPQQTHEFNPKFSPDFVRQATESYYQSPENFKPDFLDDLKKHAEHYKIDFKTDPTADDFGVASMVKQAGSGFIEGFTTLQTGKPPQNEYEGIARSLGHLAGFVGFIPNVPALFDKTSSLAQAIPKLKGMSIPMLGATAIQKQANGIASNALLKAQSLRGETTQEVVKFLTDPLVKDVIEGGFHLGTASAISSWQGGVDDMMTAFMHGGTTGGVFRGIGNAINTGNVTGDKSLRALVSSLYDGLPSTIRGDTTAEQIYSYVLGGYFGWHETPWESRLTNKYAVKMNKKGIEDPELLTDWDKLHPREQKVIKEKVAPLVQQQKALDVFKEFIQRNPDITPEEYLKIKTSEPGTLEGTLDAIKEQRAESRYNPDFFGMSGGNKFERWLGNIAEKAGLRITHYRTPEEPMLKDKDIGMQARLQRKDLTEADPYVERALKSLNMKIPKGKDGKDTQRKQNELRKEYIKLKHADQVFVIDQLEGAKPRANKNGVAIKMAQELNKDVWVYNHKDARWYFSKGGDGFRISEEQPTLRKYFAITGDPQVSKRAKASIKNLFERSGFLVEPENIDVLEKNKINAESDTFSESRDTGESPRALPTKRTENFVREHLAKNLTGKTTGEVNRKILDATIDLDNKILEYIDRNEPNINRSEDFVKYIEDAYKVKFKENSEIRRNFRTIFKRRLEDQPVQHLSYIVGDQGDAVHGDIEELHRTNPETRTMESKLQSGPRTFPERIYDVLMQELGLEDSGDNPIKVLDHFIGRDQVGKLSQLKFSQYVQGRKTYYLRKNEFLPKGERLDGEMAQELAYEDYRQSMEYVNKYMRDSGYHYFGGRGDAEKNFYIRFHPALQKTSVDRYWEEIALGDKPAVPKMISELNNASSEYGTPRQDLKKEFVSNVLWDLSLNGYDVNNLSNIKKSLEIIQNKDTNFIGDKKGVIDLNKRFQILLTNGYAHDPNYVEKYLKSESKNVLTIDNEGNRAVKALFVKDALGSSRIDALARDMEQSTDGGVLVEQNLLESQLKDSGREPESGFEKSFITSSQRGTNKGAIYGKYAMHDAGDNLSKWMRDNQIGYLIYNSSAKQRGDRKSYDFDENGIQGIKTKIVDYKEASTKKTDKELRDEFAGEGIHEYTEYINELQPTGKGGKGKPIRRIDEFKKYDKDGNFIRDDFDSVTAKRNWAAIEGNKYIYNEDLNLFIPKGEQYKISKEPVYGQEIPDIVHIPLKDVKDVLSVTSDSHVISDAAVPKQMFTSLTPYTGDKSSLDLMPKVVRSMHNDLILKGFNGTSKMDREMRLFKESDGSDRSAQEKLLDNIEDINVNEMFERFKDPKYSDFTAKAYQKILKINKETLKELVEEGEISTDDMQKAYEEMNTFDSIVDRIISTGGGDVAVLNHKFTRDYVQQSLRNFIVKKATRPKVSNSGSAVMRPYDPFLRKEMPELDSDDTLFLLDEGWRKKKIFDEDLFPEGWDLEKLWNEYNSKNIDKATKERYGDILEAITARVPMDSISGAQVLRFGGFTGRKGHGIVMHPRAMKAEGGADLDGDKTFIFFNMKKDWKDAYKSQKKEHYKGDTFLESKEDQAMVEKFTIGSQAEVEREYYNKAAYYNPVKRKTISDNASIGRNTLGPAVVAKQLAVSAHAEVANNVNKEGKKGETDWLPLLDFEGKKIGEIKAKAKTSESELAEAKRISRAAVAFPSDPMDFAKLVPSSQFRETILDSYFDYEVKGTKGKWKQNKIKDFHKKQAVYNEYHDLNNAMFGRNWESGKKWSYYEILEKISPVRFKDEDALSTMLPRFADTIKDVKWREDILDRVDIDSLKVMYDDYAKIKKNYTHLRGPMDRLGFPVKMGKTGNDRRSIIRVVLENNLHDPAVMKEHLRDGSKFKKLSEFFNKDDMPEEFSSDKVSQNRRMILLEKITNQARDYIVNDISDIAGIKMVAKYADKEDASTVERLHKESEKIKRDWIVARQEIKEGKPRGLKEDKPMTLEEMINLFPEEGLYTKSDRDKIRNADKLNAQRTGESLEFEDKLTNTKSQVEIDESIKKVKDELTDNQKDLFDSMMISGFGRGNAEKMRDVINIADLHEGKKQKLLDFIASKAVNNGTYTHLIKAGYNSKEVSDKVLQEFFKEYNTQFKVADTRSGDKVLKEIDDSKDYKKVVEIDGVKTEVDLFESETVRKKIKDLLSEDPVTLDAEQKVELEKLIDNIAHFNTIDASNLNGLFRGITGKDITAANMFDVKNMNRALDSIKKGTWWQAMVDSIKEGDTGPAIRKWHWMMFPDAIDRDLMRRHLKLYEEGGFFLANGVTDPKVLDAYQGKIYKPASHMHRLQVAMHGSMENGMRAWEEERNKFTEDLNFLNSIPSEKIGGIEIAEMIERIAIRKHELNYARRLNGEEKIGYFNHWNEVKPYYDGKKSSIKTREFNILEVDPETGKGIRRRYSGEDLVKKVQNHYIKWNKKMHGFLKGNKASMEKYRLRPDDYDGTDPKFDFTKYLKDVKKAIAQGKPIPMTFGMDGIRMLAKEQRIGDPLLSFKNKINMRKHFKDHTTGDIDEGYFPHIVLDRAVAVKSLKKRAQEIVNSGLPEKEKAKRLQEMIHRHYSLTGDYHLRDIEEHELYQEELGKIERKEKDWINWQDISARVGSMNTRSSHLSGWDTSQQAYQKYMKGVVDQYFRQVSSMLGREEIQSFQDDLRGKWDKDIIGNWVKHFQLYVQRSMGYPNTIPEWLYKDKSMNLKGTPYAWWADNRVKNRINSISKTLGIQDKSLPENLRGITHNQLKHWSNMEARFETASLLAHPKSGIGNIGGGTALTIQSAGLKNWRDSRDYNYLKTNIDPSLDSRDAVTRFVIKQGVLEDFLAYEASLNPHFKGSNYKKFFNDATEKIMQNPNLKDSSLMSLAEKYGINEDIFQKAAYFMKKSERLLRVDSFMSHYIQAYKAFSGAINNFEHPFLIKLAKKGVKSTQFMYSSPFRPAFADTALGKVFARFQLWGWNSVAFRNEVLRDAKMKGFQEGTQEFEKFKRMATIDMFTLGLAGIFTYSLFESTLPAPYNWFQDTADWMFGDESERDRAFFGSLPTQIAPLQMVMPPIMRLPAASFKALVEDDWSRVSDYYMYTMFPFGRIVKDTKGVLENPMYAIEKMTGLPYVQAARKVKELGTEDVEPVVPSNLFQ